MNAEDLARENRVALQLIQAMLGLIDEHMMSVAFTISADDIRLEFLVSRGFDGIEDIEDIKFELDALTDARCHIGHTISFADETLVWPTPGSRLVLRRKH